MKITLDSSLRGGYIIALQTKKRLWMNTCIEVKDLRKHWINHFTHLVRIFSAGMPKKSSEYGQYSCGFLNIPAENLTAEYLKNYQGIFEIRFWVLSNMLCFFAFFFTFKFLYNYIEIISFLWYNQISKD